MTLPFGMRPACPTDWYMLAEPPLVWDVHAQFLCHLLVVTVSEELTDELRIPRLQSTVLNGEHYHRGRLGKPSK